VNYAFRRELLCTLDRLLPCLLNGAGTLRVGKLHLPIAIRSLFNEILAMLGHSVASLVARLPVTSDQLRTRLGLRSCRRKVVASGPGPHGLQTRKRRTPVSSAALHAEEQRCSRREAAEVGFMCRQCTIFTERDARHIEKGLALDIGADGRLRSDIARRDPVLSQGFEPRAVGPAEPGLGAVGGQAEMSAGIERVLSPVTKMLQPPLSNGPRLARRVLTVPQSPLCTSTFMPAWRSSSAATSAKALSEG
jgi:hypothetical protein